MADGIIFEFYQFVLKILQTLIMHLIKDCLYTKELKQLLIRLDKFWLQIWNQWLKLSGKNTQYFFIWGFGSKINKFEQVWAKKIRNIRKYFFGLKVAANSP